MKKISIYGFYTILIVFFASIATTATKVQAEENKTRHLAPTATPISENNQPQVPTQESVSADNLDRLETVEQLSINRSEKLYSMTLSPSGKLFATGEFDDRSEGTAAIHVYRAIDAILMPTGTIKDAHEKTIRDLAFSPDDKYLASVSWDYRIRIWDTETLSLVTELDGTLTDSYQTKDRVSWLADVFIVTYSPDGTYLAAAMSGNQIKLWDTTDYSLEKEWLAHDSYITTLCFSADGTKLLSGSADTSIKLWDIQTAENLQVLRGHTGPITEVGFFPDGRRIYSAGDRTIRIWDLEDASLEEVLAGHEGRILGVDVSPDGDLLFSVGEDSTAYLWYAKPLDIPKFDVTFDEDGELQLWYIKAQRELSNSSDEGEYEGLFGAAFTPDGKYAYSVGFNSGIMVWGSKLGELSGQNITPVPKFFQGLQFSQDRNFFTIQDWERLIMLTTGKRMGIVGIASPLEELDIEGFSKGRRFLIDESETEFDFLRIGQGATRTPIKNLGVTGIIRDISKDQSIFAVTYRQTIYLIDSRNGNVLRTLEGHASVANTNADYLVYDVKFSPDDKYLVSRGSDTTVRVWDAKTGENLYVYKGYRSPNVTFSKDSKYLAISSGAWVFAQNAFEQENHAFIYSLDNGEEIALLSFLKDEQRTVTDLAFSADSSIFAIATKNHTKYNDQATLWLWDVATQELLATYDDVIGIDFSSDGTKMITLDLDTITLRQIAAP